MPLARCEMKLCEVADTHSRICKSESAKLQGLLRSVAVITSTANPNANHHIDGAMTHDDAVSNTMMPNTFTVTSHESSVMSTA